MPKGRGGIPDRWLEYSKIGEPISGTRFVAFKTPLAEAGFGHLLRDSQRFSPDDLVDRVPDLGLVIDLTNTNRYYPRQRLTNRGVQYRKLRCVGRQVPSEDVIREFIDVVKEFLQQSAPGSRALIGVHCTHGLNRTGFLVCSYMIRRMGFSPRAAIDAFQDARGHPMEREELLSKLRATPTGGPAAAAPRAYGGDPMHYVSRQLKHLSVD